MGEVINGIQQIGIGVHNAKEVFNWYRKYLGFDILLFKDKATATLMANYTGGIAQRRNAYLSLNMLGGGGLEIWQYKSRKPQKPLTPMVWGDLGINAMKVRSSNLKDTLKKLQSSNLKAVGSIEKGDNEGDSFKFVDPWGNFVVVVEDSYYFSKTSLATGGVLGAVIGVSNMETSLNFYKNLLGYTNVLLDQTIVLDSKIFKETSKKYRRLVLAHERKHIGGFGELLGPTQIELIQALEYTPKRIFEDRFWGDLGYIHLCFDVQGMIMLREKAEKLGYGFTVDSANSFHMGDAAGHFSYVEDPDGTLIEFVETHKVPILKKLGLYLDLQSRDPLKPLPKWLVKALKLHKVTKDL